MEGEAGHELQLPLPGRPRDPRTPLLSRVTVEELRGPRQWRSCQDHTVSVRQSLPVLLPRPRQGSLGLAPGVLQSSGPCRIRYRVVSDPPPSALVTVMQPGQRCEEGMHS